MKTQKLFKADFLWREFFVICSLVFALMSLGSVKADTPQLISYQAYITDSTGTPVNQTTNVTFNIWDDPVGGSTLWSETHVSVSIVSGNLSVLLGSVTPLDNSLFSDTGLYLGVQIGADPELSPRSRLTSVPYSYRTGSIAGASGGSVSGAITISPDPAKATGDAIVILDGNSDTVMTTTTSVQSAIEVSLFDPVDSKDGFAVPSVMRVVISPTGIVMFDSTGIDTTVIIDSDGQILVGPNSSGSVYTTVFGPGNIGSGDTSSIGGGSSNTASGVHSVISGGRENMATALFSTVGGGYQNEADSVLATVGGGTGNYAGSLGSTVGGGGDNVSSNFYSTVGGGANDTASGFGATVAGGVNNNAEGQSSSVGGGESNLAAELYSTVAGGQLNEANGVKSGVAGGENNSAGSAAVDTGAFVGGGENNSTQAKFSTVGGGKNNDAWGNYTTIGGGLLNFTDSSLSTISGGLSNFARGFGSTVAGGTNNYALGSYSTVGGGESDTASGAHSTVGGGFKNSAKGIRSGVAAGESNLAGDAAVDTAVTIGGGFENEATNKYATISGGRNNIAGGDYAAIGGGARDTATGGFSTIPGGYGNLASADFTFAAGFRAKAVHPGSFVWSSTSLTGGFSSSALDQFNVRAVGGVRMFTNDSLTSGVTMGAGASAWSAVSDRNVKKDFREVDSKELLEKLSEIPISRWKYMAEKSQADHIGPMAQDFYSAFGLGDDDKHISTIDADGVALAAVQALYKRIQELEEKIKLLEEVQPK